MINSFSTKKAIQNEHTRLASAAHRQTVGGGDTPTMKNRRQLRPRIVGGGGGVARRSAL